MARIEALRLLNRITSGQTDAIGLTTALSSADTYGAFQGMLSERDKVMRMLGSDAAWAAVRDSNTGIAMLTGSVNGCAGLLASQIRINDLLSNRSRLIYAGTTAYANIQLMNVYRWGSYHTNNGGFGTTTINGVTYGNGLYVAVGESGQLTTSTDGITWTARTSGFDSTNILGVTYGNGLFVAVGVGGKLTTSTDGITWTARTSGFGVTVIRGVTYGNGLYVAVGAAGVLTTSC
jgi:hypothetical protein